MKKNELTKVMVTTLLGSLLMSGSVFADGSVTNNAKSAADEAGAKADSSMNKVGTYLDDSAVTTKVKSELLAAKDIKSTDISVETTHGVVLLTGEIDSKEQSERVTTIVRGIEGVKSVKNDLVVKP